MLVFLSSSFFNNVIVALDKKSSDKKRAREYVPAKKRVVNTAVDKSLGAQETGLEDIFAKVDLVNKSALESAQRVSATERELAAERMILFAKFGAKYEKAFGTCIKCDLAACMCSKS